MIGFKTEFRDAGKLFQAARTLGVEDGTRMLSVPFSSKMAEVKESSEKWPPYNVCSLPFNIKPNSEHIKLKEPHKR